MKRFLHTIKNGFISGLKSLWFLVKIIIPVFFFITAVKHTPVMDWLVSLFAPLMGLFHLPGDAAMALMTTPFIDEYGAIAAMKAVNMEGFAVSIIGVMALISHSLIVEAAILKKMDLSVVFFTSYRVIAAIIVGIILGLIGEVLNLL